MAELTDSKHIALLNMHIQKNQQDFQSFGNPNEPLKIADYLQHIGYVTQDGSPCALTGFAQGLGTYSMDHFLDQMLAVRGNLSFENVTLAGIKFDDIANYKGRIDFSEVNIEPLHTPDNAYASSITNANGINFYNASFDNVFFDGATSNCDFRQASLNHVNFKHSGATQHCVVNECRFDGSYINDTHFPAVENCNFTNANFERNTFWNTTKSNFDNVISSHSQFYSLSDCTARSMLSTQDKFGNVGNLDFSKVDGADHGSELRLAQFFSNNNQPAPDFSDATLRQCGFQLQQPIGLQRLKRKKNMKNAWELVKDESEIRQYYHLNDTSIDEQNTEFRGWKVKLPKHSTSFVDEFKQDVSVIENGLKQIKKDKELYINNESDAKHIENIQNQFKPNKNEFLKLYKQYKKIETTFEGVKPFDMKLMSKQRRKTESALQGCVNTFYHHAYFLNRLISSHQETDLPQEVQTELQNAGAGLGTIISPSSLQARFADRVGRGDSSHER